MLADLEKKLPNAYKLITVALVATALINAAQFGYENVILSMAFAVAVAQILDLAITYFRTKKFLYSDSPTILALIVANVIIPGQFLYIGVATASAMILKSIIRYENKPVFNPAALGMFVMPLLLSVAGVSSNALDSEIGWGNSTLQNTFGTVALLVLGLLVSLKIKRLAVSISTIIASALMSLLMFGGIPFLPLFGAFFMYTEPKTSPIKVKHQVIFGVSIFVLAIVFAMAGLIIQYAFSVAFFSANLLKIWMEKSKF